MTATKRRGGCRYCGRSMELRKDGKVRPHGPNNRRCPGSQEAPGGKGLDWLLNHRSVFAEVVEHFWHLEDGDTCDCEEKGRV